MGAAVSSPSKRYALPAMLLANDLLSGEVVFRTATGWSPHPAAALIAYDEAAARALEATGQAAFARNEVVEAYLVDVMISADGMPLPNHFRERFKTLGPSNRPDLGKQADRIAR